MSSALSVHILNVCFKCAHLLHSNNASQENESKIKAMFAFTSPPPVKLGESGHNFRVKVSRSFEDPTAGILLVRGRCVCLEIKQTLLASFARGQFRTA